MHICAPLPVGLYTAGLAESTNLNSPLLLLRYASAQAKLRAHVVMPIQHERLQTGSLPFPLEIRRGH